MATHVIFHEVDDVEHWLSSPKREEVFGPMGITVRTFRDPQGSSRLSQAGGDPTARDRESWARDARRLRNAIAENETFPSIRRC